MTGVQCRLLYSPFVDFVENCNVRSLGLSLKIFQTRRLKLNLIFRFSIFFFFNGKYQVLIFPFYRKHITYTCTYIPLYFKCVK